MPKEKCPYLDLKATITSDLDIVPHPKNELVGASCSLSPAEACTALWAIGEQDRLRKGVQVYSIPLGATRIDATRQGMLVIRTALVEALEKATDWR